MDYYVDIAAFEYPKFNWANVAQFEPKRQEKGILSGRTEFTTAKIGLFDFFSAVTGPLAATANPSKQSETIADTTVPLSEFIVNPVVNALEVPPNSDVERIAKQRVQLMAVKYASGIESSEILARLEILNHRLLDCAPRVSNDQVIALENANDQLAHIRASREERSRRLGIPAKL